MAAKPVADQATTGACFEHITAVSAAGGNHGGNAQC